MAERIPQSTAYLVVFRAYLASDGKTPATGKTIAITVSKNGATSFSNPNAGATNATEMASGFYKFTLDTTDTGTVGPLAWRGAEGTINDAGDVLSVVKATNAGFSALPDAVADAAGGLPISDAGGLDLDARLDAAVSSRATPAQVNSEVVDGLAVDTYAETSGVPAATATLAAKISRIYDALINGLTVTATKKQFKNAAGSAQWEKDLSDDGTTYTETAGNAP